MSDFEALGAESPGVEVLAGMIRAFAASGETAEAIGEHYYRFVIDTVILGLEHQRPQA